MWCKQNAGTNHTVDIVTPQNLFQIYIKPKWMQRICLKLICAFSLLPNEKQYLNFGYKTFHTLAQLTIAYKNEHKSVV